MFFGEFCCTSRIFLVSVLLSASVERCYVSRMRDFLFINYKFYFIEKCKWCVKKMFMIWSPVFPCLTRKVLSPPFSGLNPSGGGLVNLLLSGQLTEAFGFKWARLQVHRFSRGPAPSPGRVMDLMCLSVCLCAYLSVPTPKFTNISYLYNKVKSSTIIQKFRNYG